MSKQDNCYEQRDSYYDLIDNYYKPARLAIEQLRKFSGFENVENDEAIEIIDGLYHLSVIIFKNFKRK